MPATPKAFASPERQPISRADIAAIRGVEVDSFERAIDAHVKNLRHKLEPDSRNPRYVLTVHGLGYKFSE